MTHQSVQHITTRTLPRPWMQAAGVLAACAGLLPGAALGAAWSSRGADDSCGDGCLEAKLDALMESAAVGPAGYDEATGKAIRNYAPERVVDIEHMRLAITIPDMNTRRAECRQTLRVAPIAYETSSLTLDARGMTVRAVTCLDHEVSFEHDGRKLTMHFSPSLAPGASVEVVTTYDIIDPERGMIWTPESADWPGRAAQLHTQGQPETNSYWFPCLDFPNEKMTTEIIATVPAGFVVSSNGHLVERGKSLTEVPGRLASRQLAQCETFHWLQDKPHVAYLVSLVVGKFDVVDVGDAALSMPVYVPVGRGKDVQRTYGKTKEMVDLFSRLTGQPYAWDRYAQLVAINFEAGGMENTSATTMHENAVLSEAAAVDHDYEGLIAHELAHQWFGDLTTCNTWEHIWLNEGFATYFSNLWFEHSKGHDGYVKEMLGEFGSVLNADTGQAPDAVGMCSKVYGSPWETFRRAANPYPKGASILHMLRMRLGDEVFFAGIREFVSRHKFTTVETFELRDAMEHVSGRSLEQFFQQWCMRPGTPSVKVSWTYDPSRAKARFELAQTQPINADNPAFDISIPVFIKNSAGPDVLIEPRLFTRSDSFEVDLEGPPRFVAVDPDLHVLARYDVQQDPAMWLAMLREGPSLASRIRAAKALGDSNETSATELLRSIAASAGEPVSLRVEAVSALGARGNAADVRSLVSAARDSWEVRERVTGVLGSLCERDDLKQDASLRDFVVRTLSGRATSDQSIKVRCTALRTLGKLKAPEALPLARQALDASSHADLTRQAGIDALQELAPADALRSILPFTREGFDARTRGAAADAVVSLKAQDPEAAFHALAEMVQASDNRSRAAGANMLAALGDARGIDVLTKAMKAAKAPEIVARLREPLKRLQKAAGITE